MSEYYTTEMSGRRIATAASLGVLVLGEMFGTIAGIASGNIPVATMSFCGLAATGTLLINTIRGPRRPQMSLADGQGAGYNKASSTIMSTPEEPSNTNCIANANEETPRTGCGKTTELCGAAAMCGGPVYRAESPNPDPNDIPMPDSTDPRLFGIHYRDPHIL